MIIKEEDYHRGIGFGCPGRVLPPVTAIKLALILPTACVLTSRLLHSLLYTHHADHAISTWYQISDPAHQRPCPALRIIGRPALLILLGKMISRLLSIASWHN
jgi:hypothetical protein